MSRVPPTPVDVLVDGSWVRGVVRTCEISADRLSCTAVVSYGPIDCVTTGRFPATAMRSPDGRLGCPADHHGCGCADEADIESRVERGVAASW